MFDVLPGLLPYEAVPSLLPPVGWEGDDVGGVADDHNVHMLSLQIKKRVSNVDEQEDLFLLNLLALQGKPSPSSWRSLLQSSVLRMKENKIGLSFLVGLKSLQPCVETSNSPMPSGLPAHPSDDDAPSPEPQPMPASSLPFFKNTIMPCDDIPCKK